MKDNKNRPNLKIIIQLSSGIFSFHQAIMNKHILFVAETAKYKEFQTVQNSMERNVNIAVMAGLSSLAQTLPYGTPGDVYASMRHIFLLINLYQSCLPALFSKTEEMVIPFLVRWVETLSREGQASKEDQDALKHLLCQGSLFTRTGPDTFSWGDNYTVATDIIRRLQSTKERLHDICS